MTQTGKTTDDEQIWIKEFIKDLETTAEQIRDLLSEINTSKVELASIKTRLTFIVDNVSDLSKLIRDGNDGPSLVTRVALIEKNIDEVKDYVSKDSEEDKSILSRIAVLEKITASMQETLKEIYRDKENTSKKLEEKSNRWRFYAVLIGGVVAVAGSIISAVLAFAN